ncbi:hypothetical protein BD324DRAFT_634051 [Kockovaella imperatae]|uniref:Uncharacterized protein n=1 Tax=Kockovaella imperatae TaxID=4999 RepID=A0A1Y1UAV5_9TREE|nr:hypothetical protein BD324DRAFT_634051 [Kockovaella imperatae]ORX35149.1 hypothetical protein BD324DRAFT_634051 [Kockovaella imperatae]
MSESRRVTDENDPPSSPLHLSVPSTPIRGLASRLITSECRIPTQVGSSFKVRDSSFTLPSPAQGLDIPYDLSFLSPATDSSTLPRGILHRTLSRAPPNTPDSSNLNDSPENVQSDLSVRFDTSNGSLFSSKRLARDPTPYPPPLQCADWLSTHDQLLPQPKYSVVRPWLKDILKRTATDRSGSMQLPLDESPNLANTMPPQTPERSSAFPAAPTTPSLAIRLANLDLTDLPLDPPSLSPTETSGSDPRVQDLSRLTWSQVELDVDDPDWSFEPIMSGQDALAALCDYTSDDDDSESDGEKVESGHEVQGEDIVIHLESPALDLERPSPQPEYRLGSPIRLKASTSRLPLKFASPFPSSFEDRDSDTAPSPFEPFYAYRRADSDQ